MYTHPSLLYLNRSGSKLFDWPVYIVPKSTNEIRAHHRSEPTWGSLHDVTLLIKHTQTHTIVLWLYGFCTGQPGWAGTRRNIRPLTPIVVINRPLSASSIQHDPRHPPCSTHVPDSLFPQSLSKFSLVYLLAWHPPLHTPYLVDNTVDNKWFNTISINVWKK